MFYHFIYLAKGFRMRPKVRSTLNQIYISYVLPVLEYSSVVWDGCSDYNTNTLEKIQIEAACIVTGLT